MRIGGNFMQQGGSLSLDACKASGSGGGIHVHGSFTQQNGSVANFQACQAEQSGGGLHVQHNIALTGSAEFRQCAAAGGQAVCTKGCLVIISSGVICSLAAGLARCSKAGQVRNPMLL